MTSRRMRQVAFLLSGPTAHHHGMWRHPETDNNFLAPEYYEHIARVLEGGFFDALFFADILALMDFYKGGYETVLSRGGQMGLLDPIPILAQMARVTRHIGLGGSVSTSFVPAFQTARIVVPGAACPCGGEGPATATLPPPPCKSCVACSARPDPGRTRGRRRGAGGAPRDVGWSFDRGGPGARRRRARARGSEPSPGCDPVPARASAKLWSLTERGPAAARTLMGRAPNRPPAGQGNRAPIGLAPVNRQRQGQRARHAGDERGWLVPPPPVCQRQLHLS